MADNYRNIPAVDKLINNKKVRFLIDEFGHELVKYSIRNVLNEIRDEIKTKLKSGSGANEIPSVHDTESIIKKIEVRVKSIGQPSLRPVINATGIILHTNLGRAPLGGNVLNDMSSIIAGYSNLEFDLQSGKRGHRKDHITELLKFLTGAEDALVVNNNAAGVLLALKTFAYRKEVIISRGELIEIGGSFRIPEIMKAGGAKMVEVGTTNMTRIADYQKAVNDKTSVVFKAHKSNYYLGGFSEEVELNELSRLTKKNNLLLIYDIGSGLLRKPKGLPLKDEPDVRSGLKWGADLITFSCDKLLGGPQAGIIAGKKELIAKLSKTPMMRALRVDKLIIAALQSALINYTDDKKLVANNPAFAMLNRTRRELKLLADKLFAELTNRAIESYIIETKSQCGGGTLPHLEIPSYAVVLKSDSKKFAEHVHKKLRLHSKPVLAILREGKLMFDVLSIYENDIPFIAESVKEVL